MNLPDADSDARPIRQVDPPAILRAIPTDPEPVPKYMQDRLRDADMSIAKLRELNDLWMGSTSSYRDLVYCTWTIALRFTDLGIAPVWRGGLRFSRDPGWPAHPLRDDPEQLWRPKPAMTRNSSLRWIDLQWLRHELGPRHRAKVEYTEWRDAFDSDDEVAAATWLKVNRLHWSSRHMAAIPAYEVLQRLSIPEELRVGLTGLVDSATAERRNVAWRRRNEFRQRLLEENELAARPLAEAELGRRVEYFEAVELARGQPAQIARILGWISGRPISRQSALEMRRKLAQQYGLQRLAWLGQPRKSRNWMYKAAVKALRGATSKSTEPRLLP